MNEEGVLGGVINFLGFFFVHGGLFGFWGVGERG